MGIYCDRYIFEALEGLEFPADKLGIILHACRHGASEGVVVALNQLEDGIFFPDISAVCENVSLVCSLDVIFALDGLDLPATKAEILSFVQAGGASEAVIEELQQLPTSYTYRSLDEICRNLRHKE
ncbi:MAG: DUF2795 domain-containing protein, partial [Anaerolineae bacterium]